MHGGDTVLVRIEGSEEVTAAMVLLVKSCPALLGYPLSWENFVSMIHLDYNF